jgi:hypothetical protein
VLQGSAGTIARCKKVYDDNFPSKGNEKAKKPGLIITRRGAATDAEESDFWNTSVVALAFQGTQNSDWRISYSQGDQPDVSQASASTLKFLQKNCLNPSGCLVPPDGYLTFTSGGGDDESTVFVHLDSIEFGKTTVIISGSWEGIGKPKEPVVLHYGDCDFDEAEIKAIESALKKK